MAGRELACTFSKYDELIFKMTSIVQNYFWSFWVYSREPGDLTECVAKKL